MSNCIRCQIPFVVPSWNVLKKPIFFVLFFVVLPTTICWIGPTNAEMRILPPGLGPDGSVYVLSAGSRLELACRLERNDFEGQRPEEEVNSIDWMRGQLRIAHNWLSMFTQPKVDEKHGQWIQQTLVIPEVDTQAGGEYRCVFYGDQQRDIHLHVLDHINWHARTDKPGEPVGQPLTIDCGANGIPEEAIQILDEKGKALDESTMGNNDNNNMVLVAGSEATIQRLGREHQGMKIRCVALRHIQLDKNGADTSAAVAAEGNGRNTILHTDERELTVDVWLPPKFDLSTGATPHYAVPGSKQVLRWRVLETNPHLKLWKLRKDGRLLVGSNGTGERGNDGLALAPGGGGGRFHVVAQIDQPQPMFAVSIEELLEEDFGRYTLTVHNGKLESEQTLVLVMTKPPSQPRVRAEWVSSNGSVSWRVEEQQSQSQLPIAYFWIIYRPIRRVQIATTPMQNATLNLEMTHKSSSAAHVLPLPAINPNASSSQLNRLRRRKNPANLYDIAGLDRWTEYEFTFVAGNDAGESDPLSIKIITVDRPQSTTSEFHNLESSSGSVSNVTGWIRGNSVFLFATFCWILSRRATIVVL